MKPRFFSLFWVNKNGKPIIDNGTLFALTLLIAESKPEEMDVKEQTVWLFWTLLFKNRSNNVRLVGENMSDFIKFICSTSITL